MRAVVRARQQHHLVLASTGTADADRLSPAAGRGFCG